MSLIFISYRREDSAGYAGRLHESLERRFGRDEVFRDADTLEPGQDFVDAIAARLRDCRACIVLIGREWLDVRDASGARRLDQDSDYVRLEIVAALARPDVVVIPVLVEGMSMPTSSQLPEAIRTLARRQATSVRDEAWDEDVDRLVRTLQKTIGATRELQRGSQAMGPSPGPASFPSRSTLTWALAALALVAALVLSRPFFVTDRDAPASAPLDGQEAAATSTAQALTIPRVAEVAHGSIIYTLLSGDVAAAGGGQRVRFRIRFSNEGRYPANFWNSSFRLAVRGSVLEPSGDLNEVVGGHSITQGLVSFDAPADASAGTLRIVSGESQGDIPLSLAGTGTPSVLDTADTGDALSRAIMAPLLPDPAPPIQGKEVTYLLASATARRFANTLRIFADVRMTNQGRYPRALSADAVRLVADGQPIAPLESPYEVVAPEATASVDFDFDAAPAVTNLRLRIGSDPAVEVPLEIPQVLR